MTSRHGWPVAGSLVALAVVLAASTTATAVPTSVSGLAAARLVPSASPGPAKPVSTFSVQVRVRSTSPGAPAGGLPRGVAKTLSSMGITYTLGRTPSAGLVSKALDEVSQFDFIRHAQIATVVAVTYTSAESSRTGPTSALMVVLEGQPVPIAGPVGTPPGSQPSTFVAFLSPGATSVLQAVSFAH